MVIHQTSEQLHGYVLLWLKQWHTQIINASCPFHPDHVLPHIFSHSCLPLFLMARPPGVAGHSEIRSSMWSALFRFLLRRVIWILLGQSLSCCWYFFSNFQWTFFFWSTGLLKFHSQPCLNGGRCFHLGTSRLKTSSSDIIILQFSCTKALQFDWNFQSLLLEASHHGETPGL